MPIIPISAFSDNYIWAIVNQESMLFDCVDPGEASPVLHFAQSKNLQLRSILLTHHHHDHIGGVHELIKHFPNCTIYGPQDARIPFVTHQLQANQQIQVGQCSFKIIFNPGHTSTHISYYEPQQAWLFCGDTLFSAGCGRVFDGSLQQLHHSLNLFKSLPPTTKIFCAHEYTENNLHFAQKVEPHNRHIQEYLHEIQKQHRVCTLPSSIKKELLINPFLRTQEKEVQAFAKIHGAVSSDSLEIFRVLRDQKNLF